MKDTVLHGGQNLNLHEGHSADYSSAKYAESCNDALTAHDTRNTGQPNHGWSFEQSEILMRERLVRCGDALLSQNGGEG